MAKTPLLIRMEKYGAPKAWIVEVMQKNAKIDQLLQLNEEYLDIIDTLARENEQYQQAFEKRFGALDGED